MPTVILSGSTDALGRRVRSRLELGGVDVLDVRDDASAADLKALLEGGDTLVHLAGGLDDTRALLDAAGSIGVGHVVLLSSATVYGAWPGNAVPLTEDATVRPNPSLEFAVRAAERERLAAEWKLDHPGTTVSILRPAVPVAEGERGWLADGLLATAAIRAAGADDPPAQYVHLDDLADAVALAALDRLDGAFNVAPDGWITGEELRALAGRPRLSLPAKVVARLGRVRRALAPASAVEGLAPYTEHPWVVASDRLRAAGWSPAWTNQEAFVSAHEPAPWAMVSPQRRQELALGAVGVAGLGAAAAGVSLLRRRLRRPRG